MALLDQFGHPLPPVSTSRMTARASRDAGAYRGSISGWRGPQVHSPEGESRERDVMQRRAADLAANDWAAHSAVEAISGNAIGTGLVPKASIPADMLGISSESARELGKRMEWAFALWTSEADVRGQCHFADLQNLGIRTMLSLGEMLHLAVMLNEKERERQNRAFSFALQTLSPARLMTPDDQQGEPLIRDGVRLSEYGRPEGYWLATPKASPQSSFVSVEGALCWRRTSPMSRPASATARGCSTCSGTRRTSRCAACPLFPRASSCSATCPTPSATSCSRRS
ncbi:hypothetical protein HMPREF0179_05242 [Bilophila wadsworthia 3_1_6]|uniref:Uncharacterized protein n=1 Tax=Bilophila wadsworthia (strain 3_1_6) TaxID=563192 RepID=S2KTD2_BILW3|nr:phage portal protein [Bilophila wadsworthia]EPC05960.1 hypothetical protein HMPREF0179_05242 [Bilophila wadsworthia 3_1_6]